MVVYNKMTSITNASWKRKRSKRGMHEYELANGMKLLLVPKEGLKVTTANITYEVGSRMEGLGISGSSHILEHMLFKGSKKFQGKEGMWKLENLGMYMNAQTYTDRTNFFEVTDSDLLSEAVPREADRMVEPLLRAEDLKSEMTVVRNEYERGENNDFSVLHKRIFATAFMAHPYHHSTIGWRSDIENVPVQALRDYHKTYYTPNNATYTFVGNFDPEEVKKLVASHFTEIPRGPNVAKMYTTEPKQMGQRRVMIKRPSRSAMMGVAFKAVHGLHRDAIVLEVLGRVLTDGPEASLEPLRKSGVVHDVMASWERMRDPYLFTMWMTTNYPYESALQDAENALFTSIKNFKAPTPERLAVVKRGIEFGWKDKMESTRGLAMEINEAIARGDAYDVYNRFDVLKSVTVDDITRVVSKYFDKDKSTVGYFVPGSTKQEDFIRMDYKTPEYDVSPEQLERPMSTELNFQEASDVTHGLTYTKYLNTSKTHIMVSLSSQNSSYTAKEYVTRALMSQMMMKGVFIKSSKFNEAKITNFLEQNGISRSIVNSVNGVNLSLAIPHDDTKVVNKMVKLMKAELESPILDTSTFNYLKNRMIAEVNGSAGDVNNVARTMLYQSLFEKGDACYRHSTQELMAELHNLSHSDVVNEHKALMTNSISKLTILGPKLIRMASLKTSPDVVTYNRRLNNKSESIMKYEIPGKASCTVNMGMVVKPTVDLIVAVGALGSGFSGRLMKHVRDKLGLTYGIYSNVRRTHGTGLFSVSATFNPKLLQKGMEESMKIINQWFSGDLTEEEVKIQKQILLGSHNVHFDKPEVVLDTVHTAQVNGLGLKWVDDFKVKVESVTLDSAVKAIRELDQSTFRTVIAGTFLH